MRLFFGLSLSLFISALHAAPAPQTQFPVTSVSNESNAATGLQIGSIINHELHALEQIGNTIATETDDSDYPRKKSSVFSSPLDPAASTASSLPINFTSLAAAGLIPVSTSTPQNKTFALLGVGYQNYICNYTPSSTGGPAGSAITNTNGTFSLKGPKARLMNAANKTVGYHFALKKPDANNSTASWKLFFDDSRFTGQKIKTVPSPDVKNNIPWLMLNQSSTDSKKQGIMNQVQMVVRMDTVGGIPPDNAFCQKNGLIAQVPYQALYVFFL